MYVYVVVPTLSTYFPGRSSVWQRPKLEKTAEIRENESESECENRAAKCQQTCACNEKMIR